MKRLRLSIFLELTDKDYSKHNLKNLDPTFITRANVSTKFTENLDGIIPFKLAKEILNELKNANADIEEISILDCNDPDFVENYEDNEL